PVDVTPFLASLPPLEGPLDSETAYGLLVQLGLVTPGSTGAPLPERMAPFLALISALPAHLTERLLVELIGRLVEP
ncbi:MAG: pyridoxal-dependent decarboxylase, partial [Microbacteriaceae bacterium]|nr:pyridoxal-dependent decarboxylase [Microbacteriaceae bacterium]